jgi:hypothetical protein
MSFLQREGFNALFLTPDLKDFMLCDFKSIKDFMENIGRGELRGRYFINRIVSPEEALYSKPYFDSNANTSFLDITNQSLRGIDSWVKGNEYLAEVVKDVFSGRMVSVSRVFGYVEKTVSVADALGLKLGD